MASCRRASCSMAERCPHCGRAVERASDLPDLAAGIGSAPAESPGEFFETFDYRSGDAFCVRLTHRQTGKARTGTGASRGAAIEEAARRMRLALGQPKSSFFADPLPRSRRFRVEPGRDRSA